MKSKFNDLGISPPILKALEEMGFEAPTEVQSRAIPHVLNQEDLIVMSKTGSGKTAVFGVPMLQMTDSTTAGPQGLILTPTRELAVQVDSDLKQMAKHLQHKTTAVYGQHNMNVEIRALNKSVSIVTGTPGRVFDHIRQGNLETKYIRFFVLDEADRMLDMGFVDQVERIIRTLPKDRVTLLFSATIPDEIHTLCRKYMKHPVTVEIESQTMTVDTTQQVYYRVQENEKSKQLNRLLLVEQPESCVIFCNTRFMVDKVQRFLYRKGYACRALHGDIPQITRMKTLEQFKQGEFHLLVATDVAARGIHIDDLSLVINYDVPIEKDSYVHRIGRTGRAGNVGRAISLVTGEDIMTLYEIEEHIGVLIEEAELPSEAAINECRASADKWIQANSPKRQQSPGATSKSNVNRNQKKYSHSRSPQHREKHRERPSEVNRDYNTAPRVNKTHVAQQAKPAPAISKPATVQSQEINVAKVKPGPEIVHTPDSQPKKPFHKRLLQRIFGR
jgi:ATP-dependent RNA helicase DeaD